MILWESETLHISVIILNLIFNPFFEFKFFENHSFAWKSNCLHIAEDSPDVNLQNLSKKFFSSSSLEPQGMKFR